MLSGEKSSGEMLVGLKGLLGLTLRWDGRKKPKPMRKYSNGISMASGCSSVTIEPHAWTCGNRKIRHVPTSEQEPICKLYNIPRLRHWIFCLALKSCEVIRSGKVSFLRQILRIDTAVSLSYRWCLASCKMGSVDKHTVKFKLWDFEKHSTVSFVVGLRKIPVNSFKITQDVRALPLAQQLQIFEKAR